MPLSPLMLFIAAAFPHLLLAAPADFIRGHLNKQFLEIPAQTRATDRSFSGEFTGNKLEISVKAVQIDNAAAGAQRLKVEFNNLKNLFKPKRSPYEGAITNMVACDSKYEPQILKAKVLGQTIDALCGGASARRVLGACAQHDIAYWACQASLYLPAEKLALDIRLFSKDVKPSQSKKLVSTIETLFHSSITQ